MRGAAGNVSEVFVSLQGEGLHAGRRQLFVRDCDLPLLPGAQRTVPALAERWPLALASSANREIIDLVLELAGFGHAFRVTVSSEEVERGKPAPDVVFNRSFLRPKTERAFAKVGN